ncbi:MAG: hypothetical protein WBB01_04695 [Phormidesmis sp.]
MIYIEKEREMPEVSAIKPPRRKAVRLIDLAIGFANAVVFSLSVAFSNGAFQAPPPPAQAEATLEVAEDDLLETLLLSEEFAAFQREYARAEIERDLAEAEALKVQAAAEANRTLAAADQSARAMRLEASYDGVTQRYHRPEGFEITLNYPTTVMKEETEFGFKAIATPTTKQGTTRVYINLASVNEGTVSAGNPIGTVGEYPVGEGVKAF